MPDAFIYDHVRTPRGRGKADGSLHEVTALNLASQALGAIKSRNELDTGPGRRRGDGRGRSGRRGRRPTSRARAALGRRLWRHRRRRADQPLLRLRSRRGQFRRRADHVRPAGHGDRRRRRIDEPGRHRRLGRRLGGRSDDRGLRNISCRRAFPPISSPPNTDSPATTSTPMRSRARSARRRRGTRAASAARS